MAGELILIVEDTPRSAKLLLDVLPFHGYRVLHAADAEAALLLCAQQPPDLVLMDIHLPGMNGIEAVRAMRALPGMANAKYVAVTASVMPHEVASFNAVGFDLFHAKPIDLARLIEEVGRLLR